MKYPIENEPAEALRQVISPAIIIGIALAAITATYFLASSDLEVGTKTRGFSGIIVVFLIVSIGLRLWQSRRGNGRSEDVQHATDPDIGLSGLDEAKDLFAGSLSSTDAFRLVASRIRDLVPYRTILLFVHNEASGELKVVQAAGSDAEQFRGTAMSTSQGQPGACYSKRTIETDQHSVAIPLETGLSTFGVLQLLFDDEFDPRKVDPATFEAIGTRTAPLVLSSVAFEQSQTQALTDSTTDLPNERAFYLVLENQIAESQRKPDERPLTVLALDVCGFDDINQTFGHVVGDRVLAFVAEVVKGSLRQMDFFARSTADEFLVLLPTATKEISHDIIGRVQTGFFGRKFKVTDTDSIEVGINIGWAAFGTDGELPDTLVKAARARKDQSKTTAPPNVLWFPTEFAN